MDTNNYEKSTIKKIYDNKISIAKNNFKKNRSQLLPSFYVGYFNQQIDEIRGFSGWEAGIALPLFAFGKHKTNQASKINIKIAENEKSIKKSTYRLKINELYEKYIVYLKEVNFYEKTILPNLNEINSNANLMFKKGEIGYFELLQSYEYYLNTYYEYFNKVEILNTIINEYHYLTK